MEQEDEKIGRLLETLFLGTQIDALYFDRQLNAVSRDSGKEAYEDLVRFSRGRIEEFLRSALESGKLGGRAFYTYFLDNNLVCNLSILGEGGVPAGAVVTRPVLLNALSAPELDGLARRFCRNAAEYTEYRQALSRAPVVPYERILPIGEILSALSRAAESPARQVLRGGEVDPALYRLIRPGAPLQGAHASVSSDRHGGYPTYLKMKDAISRGDAIALAEILDRIQAGSVPMDRLASGSFPRSLKNSAIEVCAMCCFIAIEAGAPYTKAVDLSEEFIREMEDTENINDLYELMKSALLAFTRAVAVTHITAYSKPVRLVMEYLGAHYAEKITLSDLAEHVNLSQSYLSNLMKKETGCSLADNLNKVRIEESKKILLRANVSVTELASMVGYTYCNYFTKIFRQFTGMSPTEYKKSFASDSGETDGVPDILRLISDQVQQMMLVFPDLADAVRIVDPADNMAWLGQPNDAVPHTCYEFWSRKQSCDRCVSRMALEENRTFLKLDRSGEEQFLVLATPVTLGNRRFAVELLKRVADNLWDCTEADPAPKLTQE